jgi:hypothetical protein
LKSLAISVSCPVIKKLLKSCHYVKRKMRKCKTMKDVENRNEQFEYIAKLKNRFIKRKLPVLSIDSVNKKTLIFLDLILEQVRQSVDFFRRRSLFSRIFWHFSQELLITC